jgi:hypothetical protein
VLASSMCGGKVPPQPESCIDLINAVYPVNLGGCSVVQPGLGIHHIQHVQNLKLGDMADQWRPIRSGVGVPLPKQQIVETLAPKTCHLYIRDIG